MHNRPQAVFPLIAVIALAVALTIAMAGGATARSTFLSSPLPPTDVPGPILPTIEPAVTPEPAIPTSEPLPTATAAGLTPTVPGFLPAPTLINPNVLQPPASSALGGQPPLVGPAAPPPEATPTPDAPTEVSSPAKLIDNGVVALSYLWLCCGALGLAGAALALVWLARRSKQR